MLRLKTLGLSFSTIVRKNLLFTPLTNVPAYNFGRAGSMTQKKKEKEMEKEFEEQAKLMEEHDGKDSDGEEEDLNEDDLLEERRLEEEMDSIEYDAQLDKIILEKLNEGKSEEQIIREFFGQGTSAPKQSGKPKGKKVKEEEIDHNPERVSIFEASKHFDGFFSNEKTEEQKKSEKNFFAQVRLMEDLNKIVGSTNQEPLDRLGKSDYMKLGNKLSKWEKDEMELEAAILKGQILATGKAPPKGAQPTLIVKERGVHEEFDLAKDREELQKKIRLEELGIFEREEEATEDLPEKIEDDKENKEIAPAIQYETPEEKRIRLKTETSITQSKKATDIAFREGAKGDLVQSAKDMDLYIPEAKAGDSRLAVYKENGQPPVTQKLHKEAVEMAERFDLDLSFTKELMKQHLFKLKKVEEENVERAENQKKREKRKKVSKLLEELENAEISKTFDFDDNIDVAEITRMNKLSRKGILDIDDIKSLDDDVTLGVESPEENMNIKGGKSYEIHRLQTQKNVENYMSTLLNSSKQRIMVGVQNKYPIMITEVLLNPAITVVNVFWTALDQNMQAIDKREKSVIKIQKNLDQFAKFARGKMCRDLQFKYAMEMRFHYSEVSEVFDDVVENMEQTTPEIVEERMREEMEKGIKSEMDFEMRRDIVENEVETMAMQFMQNYNHSKTLKAGNKGKFDDEGKRKRNNKNEDGTKKKFKRQDPGKSFWDSLHA